MSYTRGIHADPVPSGPPGGNWLILRPSLPGAKGSTPLGTVGTTLHAVRGVTVRVRPARTRKTTPLRAKRPWPSQPVPAPAPPREELIPAPPLAVSSGRKCGLCGSLHVWLHAQWSYVPAALRPCVMGLPRRKWYSAVLWLQGLPLPAPPPPHPPEDAPPRYDAVEPQPRPVRRYVSRREGDDRSSYAATMDLNSWSASGAALPLPLRELDEEEAAAARRSGW